MEPGGGGGNIGKFIKQQQKNPNPGGVIQDIDRRLEELNPADAGASPPSRLHVLR